MRSMRLIAACAALTLVLAIGCGKQRANNPAVKNNVEAALDQAGLKNINVDEDRSKGVVTLKGEVPSQDDKARAEDVARQAAGNEVVANELLVTEGGEGKAKDMAKSNDDAIEARFKELVTAKDMKNQHIHADAKNGVLTLTGDVDNPQQRTAIEKDAAKIDGVTQVVNKIEVKGRKARG
ncbi:MAG: transport-associated protein [Acidobacteriaceae bacterium]|jgi:hyperosmotically inducible protein|nr:transport-associated protein [Acidobacteriaceae bacterium]